MDWGHAFHPITTALCYNTCRMKKPFDNLSDRILYAFRVVILNHNYARDLKRIRKTVARRKLRIAFLVSEVAKWKAQGIFDLMAESDLFEPFIATMELTRNWKLPIPQLKQMQAAKVEYFRSRGMKAVDIWKYGTKDTISAAQLDADIVFYQQPWDLPNRMKPLALSRRSLTFYFPYSTPNRWLPSLDLGHKLHHFLYGYIVINEELAALYERMKKDYGGAATFSSQLLPFGHPALDGIPFDDDSNDAGRCVIYAPHWSIQYGGLNPPLKYATFLENGRAILEFAKAHREVKWAFKPHPDLMQTLVRQGAWTQEEVDDYCRQWQEIGEACYDAEDSYRKLFARSRALITDCGSFLSEYGCTGKPIIRLICRNLNVEPHPAVKALYAQYYNVRNLDEMYAAFKTVILSNRDPKRDDRRRELVQANLAGHNVARRIYDYLCDLVKPK